MSRSFTTSDAHAELDLRPVRVPMRRESVFEEACNLASELPGWRVLGSDEKDLVLRCERSGGFLGTRSADAIVGYDDHGVPK